ncbi:unnamed protein product [Phytophthora lilii]|uniref:Unnamed protein product n=1 Tax=Phytophthora lilii TaxID=2077276 RepID=A0A9W6TB45_9STRA|nr:unnamed protein product [Phytophthora lilii]
MNRTMKTKRCAVRDPEIAVVEEERASFSGLSKLKNLKTLKSLFKKKPVDPVQLEKIAKKKQYRHWIKDGEDPKTIYAKLGFTGMGPPRERNHATLNDGLELFDQEPNLYEDFGHKAWPFSDKGELKSIPVPRGDACIKISNVLGGASEHSGDFFFGNQADVLPAVARNFCRRGGTSSGSSVGRASQSADQEV